jgi:anti-sigma factor RsiW
MSCADHEDDLALLVSDDLPEADAHDLHQHVARCADCRARLDEYRADALWLRHQRRTPPDAVVIEQLRARIAGQIANKPPASWTVAWLQRLFEGARRGGPQPLLAGLAAVLLLVGAAGALTRPLGTAGTGAAGAMLAPLNVGAMSPAAHAGDDDAELDELALESQEPEPGQEPEPAPEREDVSLEPGSDEGAVSAEIDSASSPGSMRIEMKTGDPDVRIIWFAQADEHESARPRRP